MTPDQARKALTLLRLDTGTGALLTPRLAGRVFGLHPADNPEAVYLGRLFGARNLMMAYALTATEGDERDRWLAWGIAVDLADLGAALAGGLRGYLSKRAAVMVGLTALGAAALGVIARGE
jgi:hypothetical protein